MASKKEEVTVFICDRCGRKENHVYVCPSCGRDICYLCMTSIRSEVYETAYLKMFEPVRSEMCFDCVPGVLEAIQIVLPKGQKRVKNQEFPEGMIHD